MRTLKWLFVACFVCLPIHSVQADESDNLRPNLKKGALDFSSTPAPASNEGGGSKSNIPVEAAVFAVIGSIAVLFVVCYPTRKA